MHHLNSRHRVLASVAVVALLVSACGSDDDADTDATTAGTEATAGTEVTEPDVTEPDVTEPDVTEPETTDMEAVDTTAATATTDAAASFDGELVGMFSIDDAVCDDAADVSGSYFRMLQPGASSTPDRSSRTPTRHAPTPRSPG